jgi:hypothetical protein
MSSVKRLVFAVFRRNASRLEHEYSLTPPLVLSQGRDATGEAMMYRGLPFHVLRLSMP